MLPDVSVEAKGEMGVERARGELGVGERARRCARRVV